MSGGCLIDTVSPWHAAALKITCAWLPLFLVCYFSETAVPMFYKTSDGDSLSNRYKDCTHQTLWVTCLLFGHIEFQPDAILSPVIGIKDAIVGSKSRLEDGKTWLKPIIASGDTVPLTEPWCSRLNRFLSRGITQRRDWNRERVQKTQAPSWSQSKQGRETGRETRRVHQTRRSLRRSLQGCSSKDSTL